MTATMLERSNITGHPLHGPCEPPQKSKAKSAIAKASHATKQPDATPAKHVLGPDPYWVPDVPGLELMTYDMKRGCPKTEILDLSCASRGYPCILRAGCLSWIPKQLLGPKASGPSDLKTFCACQKLISR